LLVGDLLSHPFEPASFDLVVSCAALHHMDEPRRRPAPASRRALPPPDPVALHAHLDEAGGGVTGPSFQSRPARSR
jgi:SAM-dependent methyltransferase